jgi:hypothetical protein
VDDDDEMWVSPAQRRAVQNRVRNGRDAVDRLVRTQVVEDADMNAERRWAAWCQRVRLAAARAELEAWQGILRSIGGH